MIVPKLKPSGRDREFLKYNNKQRSEVVIGWLFKGEDHRELDIKALSLGFKTLGFQSMGILHYLGLKKEFKSIFKNHSIKESVSYLELDSQDFSEIIKLLTYAEVIEESDSLNMDMIKNPNQNFNLNQTVNSTLKKTPREKNIEDLKNEKIGIQALKDKYPGFRVSTKTDIEHICFVLGVNPSRYFKTFDGVILREGLNKIEEIVNLQDFKMIELKATKGSIKDFPNNSFFGFTQNEHDFLKIFYKTYFLCIYHVDKKLCSELIDIFEFEKLTRTIESRSLFRTQYQVKFKPYE